MVQADTLPLCVERQLSMKAAWNANKNFAVIPFQIGLNVGKGNGTAIVDSICFGKHDTVCFVWLLKVVIA